MKRIKKAISLILCFCMMFGFTLEAFAASVNPSADKASVEAGESVTVTLTLDEALEDCIGFGFRLFYDPDKFVLTKGENGDCNSETKCSTSKTNKEGTFHDINYVNTDSEPTTIPAGTLYKLTFTARKGISSTEDVSFRVKKVSAMNSNMTQIDNVTVGNPVSISVNPVTKASYKVDLQAAPTELKVGETAAVKVQIDSDNVDVYNAVDVILNYDKEKLALETTEIAGYTVTNNEEAGTVRVTGYGEDKQIGDAFTLNFKAQQAGKADVKFTSAKVDAANGAISADAPEAAKVTEKVTLTIGGYQVTLPDDFSGDATTTPGEDYTFNANNTHYDYDVVAKIGDTQLTVTDNGDGSYTISNEQINGNITVTATKTAKQYDVTVTGNGAADVTAVAKATYGTDYVYTLTQDSKYAYTVKITAGGTVITSELQEGTADQYKIAGDKITGPVEINVTKEQTAGTITFEGEGAGDVVGGTSQNAPLHKDFTFKITKAADFVYAVTAVKGENTVNVKDNGDGTYTIAAADIDGANIMVNVAKNPIKTAEVYQYVKLDGKVMYLVVANDSSLTEGKVLTYDGSAMYWSEKYDGYCWLVISDEAEPEMKEEAVTHLGSAEGTKTEIDYAGDVNKTGQIDINDAQLVYDMYKAAYDNFDTVSVERFLRADMNGSKNLTVEDAAAVVSEILK